MFISVKRSGTTPISLILQKVVWLALGARATSVSKEHGPCLNQQGPLPPAWLLEVTEQGLVDLCRPRSDYQILLLMDHVGLRPWIMNEKDYWPCGLFFDCHALQTTLRAIEI